MILLCCLAILNEYSGALYIVLIIVLHFMSFQVFYICSLFILWLVHDQGLLQTM